MAAFFDVAHGTVKDWRRNGMPGGPAYDLHEIYKWLRDRRDLGAAQIVVDQKKSLEIRKLTAQVDAEERENAKARGELLERRQLEAEIAVLLIEARRVLQRVPQRLQPCLPQECEASITAECRRLVDGTLNELADRMAGVSPRAAKIADALERASATEGEAKPEEKPGKRRKAQAA